MTLRPPRETRLVVDWLTTRMGGEWPNVPVSTALPASATLPWLVATVISNPTDGGDLLSTVTTVQVDCYGRDKPEAQALAQDVRAVAHAETGHGTEWGRIAGGVTVLGSLDLSEIEEGMGRWVVTLMLLVNPADPVVS